MIQKQSEIMAGHIHPWISISALVNMLSTLQLIYNNKNALRKETHNY